MCSILPLPQVQNVCAGYVYGRYAKEQDCLSLGWLPVTERRVTPLPNTTFKAPCFEHWPTYLKLKKHVPERPLRTSNKVKLKVVLVNGTFQDSTALAFNNLPEDIRNCSEFYIFKHKVRAHSTTQAADRLLGKSLF